MNVKIKPINAWSLMITSLSNLLQNFIMESENILFRNSPSFMTTNTPISQSHPTGSTGSPDPRPSRYGFHMQSCYHVSFILQLPLLFLILHSAGHDFSASPLLKFYSVAVFVMITQWHNVKLAMSPLIFRFG